MPVTTHLKSNVPDSSTNLANFLDWYASQALPQIHRTATFLVLETQMAWCRSETGELRAGFASYMQACGHPYYRVLKPVTGKKDNTSVGLGLGSYSEGYLNTMIINSVPYAGALDEREGIFDTSGQESFLQALYPGMQSAWGRLAEIYCYGVILGLNAIPNVYNQGFANDNFDTGLLPVDYGQPTNSEAV